MNLVKTVIFLTILVTGATCKESEAKVIPNFEYYSREHGSVAGTRSSFTKKPNPQVVIYVHGWNAKDLSDGPQGSESRKIKDEILNKRPEVDSVILVDWTTWSDTINYPKAVSTYGPQVAASLSKEIEELIKNYEVQPSAITLIGHSLGAHIAGEAARDLKSKGNDIGLIIGLDPASTSVGPIGNKRNHLRTTDAQQVLSIHTDNVFGMNEDIGPKEQNIYVKSGNTIEKCYRLAVDDHKCRHRAAKSVLTDNLEHKGSIGDPKTYEHLTREPSKKSPLSILILDVSPSMEKHGRIQNLVTASNRFVKSAPFLTQVGIIIFGGYAQVSQSPLLITGDNVRQTLLSKLPTTGTSIWGTSIGAGLNAGLNMAQSFISEGICPDFILVTDGEENTSPDIASVKPKLDQACTRIHSIALGGSADKKLEELSTSTNGHVAAASDKNSLDQLSQLLSDAANAQLPVSSRPIQLPPKQIQIGGPSKTFLIDSGVGKDTKFFLSAPSSYQETMATLTDPSGQSVNSNASNLDQDAKGIFFNVPDAQPGLWSMKLSKIPEIGRKKRSITTEHNATVFVSTMAREDKPVRLGTQLSSNIVDYNTRIPVTIRAQLRKGDNEVILGARVVAYVTSPEGVRLELVMLDNGLGADDIKDDGIYSQFVTSQLALNARYEVSVMASAGNSATIRNIGNDPYASIPIEELNLESTYAFERHVIVGSLRAINSYKQPLPLPVRDLVARRLSNAELKEVNSETSSNMTYCNLTWTAPGVAGESGSVAVTGYETQCKISIYEQNGTSYTFDSTDVKQGSFTPLPPGSSQSVILEIPEQVFDEVKIFSNETGNPLQIYFTIRSLNNLSEFSEVSNIAPFNLEEIKNPDSETPGFLIVLVAAMIFGSISGGLLVAGMIVYVARRFRHVYAQVPIQNAT